MKRQIKIIVLGVIAQILAVPVNALDLLETYQLALAHDARLAAAQGAHAAGVEKLPQGRSTLLPTLSVNGERSRSDSEIVYGSSSTFDSGDRSYEERKYTASITQPLLRMQNVATYKQSVAQASAAEQQFVFAKQDMILRTAQAYFDLLAAQHELTSAVAHSNVTKAQFEQMTKKLAVGAASKLEASEARARYSIARSQEISAQNDLINKRSALRRIIHQTPGIVKGLSPNFPLEPPLPSDSVVWIERAEQSNPQLRALREFETAAAQEVERARAGHYPTVDLFAQTSSGYSTGSVYTSSSSDTKVNSTGLRFEIPIFQGGMVNSKVREAVGNLEKARAELEDARRDVSSQVIQHYSGTISAVDKVRALRDALTSSEEAARASRIGLEVGTRSFVEVLDADKQVYEVTREYIKAWHDYILNSLKLKATAGSLTDDEIVALNAHLQTSQEP